jgi:hypothetical protein
MHINLKQHEITVAIRQYITNQGINLAGKSVSIKFTAGRSESGLSAEVIIDDTDMPDFGEGEDAAPAPTPDQVVNTKAPALKVVPLVAEPKTEDVHKSDPAMESAEELIVVIQPEEKAQTKAVSLFN